MVMRAGVAAVICDVVIKLAQNIIKTKSVLYTSLMFITFIMTYVFGISAMTVIFLCLGIGFVTLFMEIVKSKQQVVKEG